MTWLLLIANVVIWSGVIGMLMMDSRGREG
jgi:hypothetical protein